MAAGFTFYARIRTPASTDLADGHIERIADLKGFRVTGIADAWMDLDSNEMPMLLRDLNTDDIYALALEEN
jgi:hypothetical protein